MLNVVITMKEKRAIDGYLFSYVATRTCHNYHAVKICLFS